MVTRIRNRMTATAVTLLVGLLAQHAAGAEAPVAEKTATEPELLVDAELFRAEIDGYVRELDERMRAALNEELRRELARKSELAIDERRTKI